MAEKNFFKKVACFTDIHFGLRNDSRQHNIDCEEFIYWFIDEAKQFGAETCIFLGDWHHNRARINASTLLYSISNIERLSKAFDNFYFITGNHDLYYRDKREVNSMEFGRMLDNVNIISERLIEGDVAIIPWLVGKEWKKLKNIKCKYMFGHFELPKFKMNQMVEMPDIGELQVDDLAGNEYVFSGHFHKRQIQGNVHYIGNAFPHNFADVWDDARGMMMLEWNGEPQYKSWPAAPKYRRMRLSEVLENPGKNLDDFTTARIEIDVPLNYEDANYIKEVLEETYNPREIILLPGRDDDDHSTDFGGELNFESVDSVVLSHLQSIDSNNIDNQLLTDIYNTL